MARGPRYRESVSSPPRQRIHRPALDGLRAVAALAVLFTHVGFATGAVEPTVLGALTARLDIGVALFFALSGYLMMQPWIAVALDRSGTAPATGRYFLRRAGRILPAYWIVTAVVLLVEGLRVYAPDLRSSLRVDVGEVVVHLLLGQGLTGNYFPSYSQTWSLTTEVTFYLVVPALGALMIWGSRRIDGHARRVQALELGCLAVIAAGVAVAAYSVSDLPGASPTLATSLLGHAAWFAGGAWVCVRGQRHGLELVRPWSSDHRFAVAAVVLLVAASPLGGNLLFDTPSPMQAGIRELLYCVVAILAVGAAASLSPGASPVMRFLSSAPLTWLGTRSYALFLWHLPILFAVLTVLGLNLFEGSFVVVAALTFTLSILVSDLSWRFIEQPVLNRVHRVGERRRSEGQQEKSQRLGQRG